jgi:hypothetical protein
VRVEGQVTVNGVDEMLIAAREGIGMGFVPDSTSTTPVASRCRRVLSRRGRAALPDAHGDRRATRWQEPLDLAVHLAIALAL